MLVGASDGRGGDDGGVAEQCFLDHPRVDVVATADDEILGSSGEVDEAVGVEAAEVASVQPAVVDEVVTADPWPVELGVGDVAGEHDGPVDHQEADFVRGAVHPGPIVVQCVRP